MIIFSAILISFYLLAILWLLSGLLSNRWLKTDSSSSNAFDGISVIVAFRNERANLPKLLESLRVQDLPNGLWEVILVDDGSTDNALQLVENSMNGIPVVSLVLPEGQSGKKQALLYGLSRARFNTIAFTDADCIPGPQWLSTIAQSMKHLHFLQGEVSPQVVKGDFFSMFEALDYLSLMAVSAASFSNGRPVIASSANLAFNRSAVMVDAKALKTHMASGDDMFLLHHAKSKPGLRLGFLASPQIAVGTVFDGGIKGFISRRSRWASKALAYTDPDTILLSAVVFIFNLWLAVLIVLSILGIVHPALPLATIAAKTLVDFPFLVYYLTKTSQQKLLVVFIPLQIVYPFYISFTAIVGLLKGTVWKGRITG